MSGCGPASRPFFGPNPAAHYFFKGQWVMTILLALEEPAVSGRTRPRWRVSTSDIRNAPPGPAWARAGRAFRGCPRCPERRREGPRGRVGGPSPIPAARRPRSPLLPWNVASRPGFLGPAAAGAVRVEASILGKNTPSDRAENATKCPVFGQDFGQFWCFKRKIALSQVDVLHKKVVC